MVQELDPDDLPVVMPYHDDVKNLDAPCAAFTDALIGADVALPSSCGIYTREGKKKEGRPRHKLIGWDAS